MVVAAAGPRAEGPGGRARGYLVGLSCIPSRGDRPR